MRHRAYKRKPGDFEIRILADGRVIMIAPDEIIMQVADAVNPNASSASLRTEITENARTKTNQAH
jgi:hypothetical protein